MGFRRLKYVINTCAAVVAFLFLADANAMDPNLAAIDVLKANPDAMSAVKLSRGNGAIFCTLASSGKMFADNDRIAVLSSPDFRAWHGRGNATKFTEIHADLKQLLFSMQNGRCNVAVESASNIVSIAEELKREGMLFVVLPFPLRSAQLADLYANSLGFSSNSDLLLAEHMMANNDELQSFYKLGITSKSAYDDAVVRMQSQGYSLDRRDIMAFLKDEAEGMRRNLSAAGIRDERNASASVSMP
jgi:hypothetical protein